MRFIFFGCDGKPTFAREDAESAYWTAEDMTLTAVFPYDPAKPITRGARLAFEDAAGNTIPCEARQVENLEPDHAQRITAEHIAISELSDSFMEASAVAEETAATALAGILTGTGWSVGNVSAANESGAQFAMGAVWQNVREIESAWNVYITPRVTFGAAGITGKYLDISPAQGVWRGVRLSLDKNADEIGVTIDDADTKTALYGFGAMVETQEGGQTVQAPLTFASVVWAQTAEHPAKPSGQKYIEDPAATAAYGRNGTARYGYYQNTLITDADVLLQKTWEALQATNAPRITIDCAVRDLYRLGYADQPIGLHDLCIVEVAPIGAKYQLEIIKLTVDLLDPTATRPTIGAHIPNIVWMTKEALEDATGSRGGSAGGRRGGGTAIEDEISEFGTEIAANRYQIGLRAYQIDMNTVDSILAQAGMELNAQGVLVYADDNANMLQAKLNVQAGQIALKVSQGDVATQLAVECGNVTISGGNLVVDGYVTATVFQGLAGDFDDLISGDLSASKIVASAGNFSNFEVTNSLVYGGYGDLKGKIINAFTSSASGGVITISSTTLDNSAGPSVNFNIADTQFYQDAVSAARTAGYNEARTEWRPDNITISGKNVTVINAAGDDVGGPYSAAAIYNDGFADGEGQFSPVTVTPIGDSVTPVLHNGYRRGSQITGINQGAVVTVDLYLSNGSKYPFTVYREGSGYTHYASGDYFSYYDVGSAATLYKPGTAGTYYQKTT